MGVHVILGPFPATAGELFSKLYTPEQVKAFEEAVTARPKPVSARKVPARFGERCCAPGCGDKIKPDDPTDTMYEVTWSDGALSYLESNPCARWFTEGHPDYGAGHGPVRGLPGDRPRLSNSPSEAVRQACPSSRIDSYPERTPFSPGQPLSFRTGDFATAELEDESSPDGAVGRGFADPDPMPPARTNRRQRRAEAARKRRAKR